LLSSGFSLSHLLLGISFSNHYFCLSFFLSLLNLLVGGSFLRGFFGLGLTFEQNIDHLGGLINDFKLGSKNLVMNFLEAHRFS
jgi:hypothetical protein